MHKNLFIDGEKILRKIESFGHKAYFVGGCVRDFLLKRPIGDIDIATSALPDEIQSIFPKVIPLGIEHGTVIVRYKQESYEVTTFRLDGTYTDQRHPDTVKFVDRIDEDLKRRDFTINALAMDKDGIVLDLFAGKTDLQQKVIRTVGNGYDRFTEDPLRIIRALRFVSQLGFSIEQDTLKNIEKVKQDIRTIAVERITVEFTKLFAGNYVNAGILYLQDTKICHYLPVLGENPHVIEKFPGAIDPILSFGEVLAHFHYIDPTISIQQWTKAWKCSNKIKQETMALINAINYFKKNGLDEWLVYELHPSYYESFARLVKNFSINRSLSTDGLTNLSSKLSIRSKHDLEVNGNDLIALYPTTKKGRWIHQTLTNIEKEVVFSRLANDKVAIKKWLKQNPPSGLKL